MSSDLFSINNNLNYDSTDLKGVKTQINDCKSIADKLWKCIDKNLNSYMCINEFYNLDRCVNKIRYDSM